MNNEDLEKEIFPFEKPLTSRYAKKFVELFALKILQYCYEELYSECEVKDAPDIQDKNKLIGVEVTEAISNEDAQISNEFVKYRLANGSKEKERRKQVIENNGGKIDDFILTYPVTDSNHEKQIFQNALRKKMEKLSIYKQQGFKKIGVFIFVNGTPIPIPIHTNDLKECFDQVLNEYESKYDIIYFGFPCGLVEYDILSNRISIRPIDRNVYNRLQYETRLEMQI